MVLLVGRTNDEEILRRGRHEVARGIPMSADEVARWCVAATYHKLRGSRFFKRKPRHIDPEHLPYHRERGAWF